MILRKEVRMLKSFQGRLTLLFAAFTLLVLISVGATMWGVETQRQDALIINLAGRQRMLTQQMARLTEEWNTSHADEELSALREAELTFARTLVALREGGGAPYLPGQVVFLPPTRDPELLAKVDVLAAHWREFYTLLEAFIAAPSGQALQRVREASTALVQHADEVVRAYQTASEAKMARLRAVQIGFLVCALMLLGAGVWLTRQGVLKPLKDLARIAHRLGENDLETTVQVEGSEEMRRLAQAFEAMRVRLRASRQELVELNQSLEERVAQRTRELEALNEVSREIASRLELQQVLDLVTEKARALLGGDVAVLCLMGENHRWLKWQALSGPRDAIVGTVAAADGGLAGKVLTSERALLCSVGHCEGSCCMLAEGYRASHLAAPLRIGERVIGALCVGSAAQGQFAEEAAAMLTKLANVAAIALENARLYAQAERVATLEERRRVAAEMHDGLGQTLSYLGLMTDQVVEFLAEGQDEVALERLHKARQTIGKAIHEVRGAINRLMDETPVARDFRTRLRDLVDEFASTGELKVAWQSEADSTPEPSPQVAEQVLNITREALNNVLRHAQAKQVKVTLGQVADGYFVSVEDDGVGFDPAQSAPRGHFGLHIMRARAAHIGGELCIDSAPGAGTRLTLTFPGGEKR